MTNLSTAACKRWCCPACATSRLALECVRWPVGNYTLALKESSWYFPEIDYTRVDKNHGMNITLTTFAPQRRRRRELLKRPRLSAAHSGGSANKWHALAKNSPKSQET